MTSEISYKVRGFLEGLFLHDPDFATALTKKYSTGFRYCTVHSESVEIIKNKIGFDGDI